MGGISNWCAVIVTIGTGFVESYVLVVTVVVRGGISQDTVVDAVFVVAGGAVQTIAIGPETVASS